MGWAQQEVSIWGTRVAEQSSISGTVELYIAFTRAAELVSERFGAEIVVEQPSFVAGPEMTDADWADLSN